MAKSTSPLARTYTLAPLTKQEARRRESRVKREQERLKGLRLDPVTGAALQREARRAASRDQ